MKRITFFPWPLDPRVQPRDANGAMLTHGLYYRVEGTAVNVLCAYCYDIYHASWLADVATKGAIQAIFAGSARPANYATPHLPLVETNTATSYATTALKAQEPLKTFSQLTGAPADGLYDPTTPAPAEPSVEDEQTQDGTPRDTDSSG